MPLTLLREVTLRDGSILSIYLGLTGFSEIQPALAELLAPSGFPDLDIIYRLLTQTTDDGSIQQHFFGFRNDRLVAFLKYDASQGVPYVCSLGYVFTAEDVRRLGIGEYMCSAAINEFAQSGGRAAFLSGTERIYYKAGFRPFNGQIQRCVIGGSDKAFDEFYFADRPITAIRNLRWADWAMAALLYGQPTDVHIRDYGIQLYSGPGQETVRFQSVIPLLMRVQEARTGCIKVAEDTFGHLLGIATLRIGEKGDGLGDFHVHPTAQTSGISLLKEVVSAAQEMGCSQVYAKAARADCQKVEIFQKAGARIIAESLEPTGTNRMEPVLELCFESA